MIKELPKAYEPSKYEDGIYKKWEKSGFFNPDNLDLPKNAPSYTIILPPPNITDKLHLGHSSMLAIEDLLIRYHRMKGFRTLWLPGTDHAAIATQNVVEKKLLKEEGKTRQDLGREKFLKKVWEFVKITQSIILRQTRKMGASLDWSREAFTLDKPREEAVKKMFIDMYEAGVIYRGERIVNWCPRCHSTLADDEVEYKDQKAKLYTFKYSKDFPFTIATTRPETKLGDTAVAVNPKDKRYKKYIGKVYEVDFVGIKLKLKIIADRHVEMDFGTGALGVTPAHSMADWQMAEANGLEIIKVIGEDGKINNNFKKYSGKTVEEAREMIVKELRKNNLLEKEEEIENNLSICYRCNTPIEPLPSKQWFVSVDKKLKRLGGETQKHKNTKTQKHKLDIEGKTLKEAAIEAVKSGKIKFIPDRFEKRYIDWMENLHDWCISRQIWFGHRIPVWHRTRKHENTKTRKHENTKTQKHEIEEIYVGIEPPKGEGWVQDPDSLDTWFSSGMWTFSTLGWPDNFKNGKKKGDLSRFHPTQVLETGYDILTLWVSRMIMMSLFALREIPFENVYLHGMVLDEHGKKMSKSKGNGIDPVDMIDKFGADAARLSLLIGNTPGNDLRLSEEKIAGFRNLVNKIWNVSRYVISDFRFQTPPSSADRGWVSDFRFNQKNLTVSDKWILGKMENLIKETGDDLDNYRFSQAGERLREFTWNDFADWYLEVSKFEKNKEKGKILSVILNDLLKLWHPFIPFVTEKIWEEMGNDKFLMIEKWPVTPHPQPLPHSCCRGRGEIDFELIKDVITAIRNARAENKIEPARKIKAVIYGGKSADLIKSQEYLIKNMRTGIKELEIKEKADKIKNRRSPLREAAAGQRMWHCLVPKDAIHIAVAGIEIYLIGAVDEEKEKIRIKKERENLEKLIIMAEKKLSNKEFVEKAPEKIVKQEKEKLKLRKEELKKLTK
ncbi:valine--tRNA ligase [Patescibacteria group bacterium]|nr:valine--tRNA ligase [Patescibacteria group bacterium]MBU4601121.1 valine--tRNA ligase [Patescibacteria group bacterium]MCG2698215.1 valine--tRNA ligase [Candidatus Parcubacteria bacterium]